MELTEGTPALQKAVDAATTKARDAQRRADEAAKALSKARGDLMAFTNSRQTRIDALGRELSDSASPAVDEFRRELQAESEHLRQHGRETLRGRAVVRNELVDVATSNGGALGSRLRAIMTAISEQIPSLSKLPDSELPAEIERIRNSLPSHKRWDDEKLAAAIMAGPRSVISEGTK